MKTITSTHPKPAERHGLAGTLSLPPIPADSGCWHHVPWPLGPASSRAGSRFRGGMFPVDRISKQEASPGGALRPGAMR